MFPVIIHTAIVTECRRGELMALKWSNINFKDQTIMVKQ
jgi:integrase